MVLVRVPENRKREMFDEFFENATFTMTGVDLTGDNKQKFKEDFEKLARISGFEEDREVIGYLYYGKDINEVYKFTQTNAYDEELIFISIPHYRNRTVQSLLAAQWFDDLIIADILKQMKINKESVCGIH